MNPRNPEAQYMSVLDGNIVQVGDLDKIKPEGEYKLDKSYYSRIEALDYTMQHDDGNNLETLENADIILVGLSRTSNPILCRVLT